jgi:uncharacterized protein (DUF2249 family)
MHLHLKTQRLIGDSMNLDTTDAMAGTAAVACCTSPIDARSLAPHEGHRLALSMLRNLDAGQALEYVDKHEPRSLHYQLHAQMPGGFGWQYVEMGPRVWRVNITRLDADTQAGTCQGAA